MTRQLSDVITQKLSNLPDSPGCYQMLDANGKVIYVGKALVLRNRVRSYFHASHKDVKTRALVREIADITWWVTETELEALILENELIKRYKPHYNIRLKDDRQYPYIKVHWQDDFPKISIVRQMKQDGARYFGPYSSSRACYQTLDALRRSFPYLDCDRTITGNDARPCLYYHIKLCGGPCIGKQTREEYRETLQQLMDFLHGSSDQVLKKMREQMDQAAENLQFELAALYRDRVKSAERVVEQQQTISATQEDVDYVAVAQDERTADTSVQVFTVRSGRLVGRENFILEGAAVADDGLDGKGEVETGEVETGEVEIGEVETEEVAKRKLAIDPAGALIASFIQQFYDEAAFIPPLILVQAMPVGDDSSAELLSQWLSEKRGGKVDLRVPRRGPKRKFMELAQRNAAEYLRVQQAQWAEDTNRQTQAVSDLQEALRLDHPPARIECYDVSTLQGTNTVGSMVVFGKGAPLKSAYKRFKIRGKGSQGEPDDFASMREMLRRRFRRAVEDDDNVDPGKKARTTDESWRILPDLVIIDGGKGQLGIAVEVLDEFNLRDRVSVVGLAKREEELFRPGESQSLWLKRGSQALFLVQRIRDEAHRFAITYHRTLRRKEQTRSKLDDVPGIGPQRRKALLQHFGGDVNKIRRSSIDDLTAVPGISRKAAEAIKEHL